MWFILIIVSVAHASITCDLESAGEYAKVLNIYGEMSCASDEHCRETFDYDIASTHWQVDAKGHCSVVQVTGTYVDVKCGCNNHWSGIDNINSVLDIQLKNSYTTSSTIVTSATGITPTYSDDDDYNREVDTAYVVGIALKVLIPVCVIGGIGCLLWLKCVGHFDACRNCCGMCDACGACAESCSLCVDSRPCQICETCNCCSFCCNKKSSIATGINSESDSMLGRKKDVGRSRGIYSPSAPPGMSPYAPPYSQPPFMAPYQ